MSNLVELYQECIHLEVLEKYQKEIEDSTLNEIFARIPIETLYQSNLLAVRSGKYVFMVKARYGHEETLKILRSGDYFLCRRIESLEYLNQTHILIDENASHNSKYIFYAQKRR